MKKAIIALDGGGSNLRMVVADYESEQPIYFNEINTGTNLSTVPNRQEAIENIQNLILEGYQNIPSDYELTGIGLSSAGTEIEQNRKDLASALSVATAKIKAQNPEVKNPELFVTNDIDILLHSSDIALVAGTGTVGAVKYKDIKPYDNTDIEPEEYTIEKLDGDGEYIGDKGSGYWIAKEVLTRVGQIEKLGLYINSNGEVVRDNTYYLRELVIDKLLDLNGYSEKDKYRAKALGLREAGLPEYVSLVYSITEENGRPFDRAKVGNLFGKVAEEAALQGDEVANDILKGAALELFKNVVAAYEKGDFDSKEYCDLLVSGSVLVNNRVVRFFLEDMIRKNYPNVSIKVNQEKPVMSTVKYVKSKVKTLKPTRNLSVSSEEHDDR